MGRWESTHEALRHSAAELFAEFGYDAVTTARVAQRAGVSEMTLFRHFPTKESLVYSDPFDPLMAEAVRARPEGQSAMRALVEGIRDTWAQVDPQDLEGVRGLLRMVGQTPSLNGAVERSSAATAEALSAALIGRGVGEERARVAVAAVISGLSRALLDWGQSERDPLDSVIMAALDVLGGE